MRNSCVRSTCLWAVLGALVLSTVASAAVTNVICVPWQGNPLRQHTALSGTPVQLKAVVKTDNTAVVYYKWIFGDGSESAVSSMSGSTQYNVETTHTYTAAVGTPFTAQLLVDPVDSSMLNAVADNYLLKIEESNLDARVNIAIDRGLWFLYKNKQVSGSYYYWTSYSSYYSSPTSAALQAFQINNHKEINNFAEDPYAEAVQKGLRYIEAGKAQGATVVLGGGRTVEDTGGNFVAVTSFDEATNDMCIATDEIFGPVLTIIPVETDAEAIAVANDTRYGLAASLYTGDVNKAHRCARQLRAGTVSVNCFAEGDITTPFGGFKESGFFGRDKSMWAQQQYTELKTIWMQVD